MNQEASIPVSVKYKSYLYNNPNAQEITKKYLANEDRATVDKATGEWCRINYKSEKRPLKMWMTCDAIDAENLN